MSFGTIRRVLLGCLLGSLTFLAVAFVFQGIETVSQVCIVMGVILLIAFGMMAFSLRCPHCDRCVFNRWHWLNMQYCPYCGEDLEVP